LNSHIKISTKYDENVKKFVKLLEELKIGKEKFATKEFNKKLDWAYPIKAITLELFQLSNAKKFQLMEQVKRLIKK
jgi:hypothetical protein